MFAKNEANYISIYVCAVAGGQYAAEKYAKELGKVSVGKSCIRIKKIEDLNFDTLKILLKIGEEKPGVLGATIV